MKKKMSFFVILLFFLCLSFFKVSIINKTYAKNEETLFFVDFEFFYGNEKFVFRPEDFEDVVLTDERKNILKTTKNRFDIVEKIEKFGLSKEEVICYVFPEVELIYKFLSEKFLVEEKEGYLSFVPNTCTLFVNESAGGVFLNKKLFFEEIYEKLKQSNKVKMNLIVENNKNPKSAKESFVEKSCFSTNFKTSSPERKHNIKKALESFDGVVLEIGETLSFNKTTGKRNENNGYKKAKIITNGTFSSGFGGGVCQVSSTLYNACLLAGLEIVEANPHSLPVSYVEPCFDAMVNEGSSDLIIKNNTSGKIVITTSNKDDVCKIKIFGKDNKYKIKRKSEVLKKIPANEERVEFDYEKYGLDLQVGEEKRVSFSKDGFESVGLLEFYDENGKLAHSKKIRQNKYYPTVGVVVKREK